MRTKYNVQCDREGRWEKLYHCILVKYYYPSKHSDKYLSQSYNGIVMLSKPISEENTNFLPTMPLPLYNCRVLCTPTARQGLT